MNKNSTHASKAMTLEIQEHLPKRKLFFYDEEVGGGWSLPHVEVWKHDLEPVPGGNARSHDVMYSLSCGPLISHDMTLEELQKWAPFLANCMAVAAGFSSFGKHSRRIERDSYGDSNWTVAQS